MPPLQHTFRWEENQKREYVLEPSYTEAKAFFPSALRRRSPGRLELSALLIPWSIPVRNDFFFSFPNQVPRTAVVAQ